MASEIWKIGQEQTALDMYKDVRENGFQGNKILNSETFAVTQLTIACQEMINAYDEVISDQNDYLLEIDDINQKIDSINNDYWKKIEELKNEIKELKQKEIDGTITEEERKELFSKFDEINSLTELCNKTSEDGNTEINNKNNERRSSYNQKEQIATDYGKTTVEKGTPLANTQVKGGFFRKLFGTTGKGKKKAGEAAVKAGNELLEKVNDGKITEKTISAKLRK